MLKFVLAVLITLSVACPNARGQTVNANGPPIAAPNFIRAVEAADVKNWAVAYRFLEDEFSHSNPQRRVPAMALLQRHPQILQAALSTFSREEILDSIQRHGEVAAVRIERRRIEMLATVADGTVVAEAKATLDATARQVEEIRLAREEKQNQELLRRKKESERRDINRAKADGYRDTLSCEQGRELASSGPENERPSFDFQSCVSERQFRAAERLKDPQAIYFAAVRYESEGERNRGKTLYLLIMSKFSNSALAVKAADRLAALTDVQAIERSNAANERAVREASQESQRRAAEVRGSVERANSDAASRAYNACRIEVEACYSRSGKNCYRDCNSLK